MPITGQFFIVVLGALVALVAVSAVAAHAQGIVRAPVLDPSTISDVYTRGGDGYPQTRIPAAVLTPKGTVLAFAEARQEGDHSENDIVVKRSEDGGVTWGPLQLISDMGGDSLNDPCAVVVPETGRVLLMFQRYPKGFHTQTLEHTKPAELGYGGPRNTQTFLTRSDDDGRTWSAPEDITRAMRRPDAIAVGSPGIGIVLQNGPHKGRIVFPMYEVMKPAGDEGPPYQNCAAISDDDGDTWRLGARVPKPGMEDDGDECQIAQAADGTIVMDLRQRTGHQRLGAVSRDFGETWEPMYHVEDLVAPPCMGSILRFNDVLLESIPNTLDARASGTLFVSRDGGQTWPDKRVLYPGGFAYSCLVQLSENRVGCFFERDDYARISFAVYDIAPLLAASQQ